MRRRWLARAVTEAKPGEYALFEEDGVRYRPRRRFLEGSMLNGGPRRKADPGVFVTWIVSLAACAAVILGVIALARWVF